MSVNVSLHDVSLQFKIYRNPLPNLKETFVNFVTGRRHPDDVIEFFALKNINVEFNPGERVGIIGRNGAGKSTLLKTIAGIYPPHKGIIKVSGLVTPMIELGTGFDMELSGRNNIYLNGAILGIPKDIMRQREEEIIDFSELGDFINSPVKYYSSGMFSRLAFSIAVMTDPEILIVDEILAAGDAHFVHKATEKMQDLFHSSQIVLFVSHSIDHVAKLCNRVIVMHEGEFVAQGESEEMIQLYQQNYT